MERFIEKGISEELLKDTHNSATGSNLDAIFIKKGEHTFANLSERGLEELKTQEATLTSLLRLSRDKNADLGALKQLYAVMMETEAERHGDMKFDAQEFIATIPDRVSFIQELEGELKGIKEERERIRSQAN